MMHYIYVRPKADE